MTTAAAMLSVNGIEVIYNHVILVLKGVSLTVPEGSIVALLGANGAGKTTTLRAVSNLLKGERGEVTKGYIEYMGERIERLTPSDLVKRGVVQVMEGRHCFAHLSVEENLLTGAYTRSGAETSEGLERVYGYFPRLKERRHSQSGYTSGGEQQMTAIGRALMARPRMILLDEPSMGLAPLMVAKIFEIVRDIARSGVTILLVEQNAKLALELASRGYVMESGAVTLAGESAKLLADPRVREAYLGEVAG
jgi:branched-chain amino acid transport system ATP-binding protein